MKISIFLSLVICIMEGTSITWPSPMIKKLEDLKDNPLGRKITSDESSLLASLPILGSIFGSFLIMSIRNKLGRKPLLIVYGTASLFCNLTLAFSANIWLYFLARFIGGFNSAANLILVPMYICELADPSSRGSHGTGMIAAINIGILIPFTLGPYIRFIWYHLFLTLIPISFIIFFSIFALESPYYYLQSDPSRAEDLLRHLKGTQDVTDTLKEMKRSLDDTTKDSFLSQIK
ncbi:hypothetical protein WA026_005973 [Henosepilachna vigintioctopunctata]|uniref:Major facilitator superfamily (MFS) profile domain-containing protein n=1 Tax=Henosepilachna vigintioctopunctata TaxID=420089 RepID=A0AAW1U3F0_9CUCU